MSGFFGGGGTAPVNMTGATSSVTGSAGYVPAPAAGDQGRALCGDATFQRLPYPDNLPIALGSSSNLIKDHIIPFGLVTGAGGVTSDLQRAYFFLYFIPKTCTINGIGFRANSTITAVPYEFGLYSVSTDFLPSTKLTSVSGTYTASASTDLIETGISYSATRGFIFGSVVRTGNGTTNGTVRGWSQTSMNFLRGQPTDGLTYPQHTHIQTNATVTSLPSSLASSDIRGVSGDTNPALFLKAS